MAEPGFESPGAPDWEQAMSRSRATRETILTEAPGLVGSTVMNVHFSEGRGVSLELGAVVGTHRRSGRPMREFSVFIGWRWSVREPDIDSALVSVEEARRFLISAAREARLLAVDVLPDGEIQLTFESGMVVASATLPCEELAGAASNPDPDWWIGLAAHGAKGRTITLYAGSR